MRGFVAVVRREVVENRRILLAALVASLLPFAVPLAEALHGRPAQQARGLAAYFVAAICAIGLGLVLGAVTLTGDLANRRLGFFFSRPISSFAIWAGKFLGTFAMIAVATAIVLIPTSLARGGSPLRPDLHLPALPILLAAAFLLLPAAHDLSVAFRSRSAVLAIDFLLLVFAMPFFLWLFPAIFVSNFALDAYLKVLAFLSAAVLLSLFSASFASVAVGRTDIKKAHRALSVTFWSVVWSAIALAGLYTNWILSAKPEDITDVAQAAAAPGGSWLAVSGKAWGRFDSTPMFIWNPSSGEFVRTGPRLGTLAFSRDGKRAAWLQSQAIWHPTRLTLDLVTATLDHARPEPRRTEISFSMDPERSDWPDPLLFSPSGNRIAEVRRGLLSIHDITSGKTLSSVLVSKAGFSGKFFFLSEDRVRIYERESTGVPGESEVSGSRATDTLNIFEFDGQARKLERTGATQPLRRLSPILANASGDRLLIKDGETTRRIALYDGRNGILVRTLAATEPPDVLRAEFLADSRIVIGEARSGTARIRIYSPDGSELRTIELGPGKEVFFGAEPSPEHLFVGVGPRPGGARSNMNAVIFLVDFATGEAHKVGQNLYPIVTFPRLLSVDPTALPLPGSAATKLFYGPNGSLVRLDPLTGERRTILAGKEGP